LRRLGQVRQLLRMSEQGRVVATCRAPDSATELQKLKEGHAPGRLTVLPLDVTDESTIEVMYNFLGEKRGIYSIRGAEQREGICCC
jgi:saccharopine dehydrogenase-like NADP-dependent oxidoreductase